MNKKFFIILVLYSIATVYTCFAQQTTDTVGVTKLITALNITREKAIELKSALQINKAAIQQVLRDQTLNPVNRQARLRELNTARDNGINALLTEVQRKKLSETIASEIAVQRQRNGAQ